MKNRTLAASALLMLTIVIAGAGPWQLSLILKIVLVAFFAIGWPRYLGIPARKTLSLVIGIVGAIGMLIAHFTPASDLRGLLGWLAPVIALGIGAVIVVQLIRGTGQSHRLESGFGSVTGVILVTSGAGWLAILRSSGGFELLPGAAACVLVVVLLSMTSWPDQIVAPFGLALGALAAALVTLLISGPDFLIAAIVAALVTAAIFLGFRKMMIMAQPPTEILSQLALGAAPVLALGSMLYFVGRSFLL
ncbi:permease [Acaricomes phytoseiuli]|uniref:permease n=1 Tax=Acaricomes phytoseiuli TaxID=291968 RepID=UPI0022227C8A|nr:permease [Acaricomes phytoseiuli]MCW1249750.1 permease [Acaricomes phytoseiuli]